MPITATPYTQVYGPLSLTGVTCSLWLDGADTTSLRLSGVNVSSWNDKSGNGNDANIVTSTPPTYSSANNSVVFTAASSTGLRGNMSSSLTNASVFIMSSYTSNAGTPVYNPRLFILGSNNSTDNNLIGQLTLMDQGRSAVITYVGNGTGNAFGVANYQTGGTISFSTPYIFTNISTYSGTTFTNSTLLNGAPATYSNVTGTKTTDANYVGSANRYVIGNDLYSTQGPNGDAYNGNVYEVIVYNSALSISQRQTVEGYLAQKWGLTSQLPPGHPGLTQTLYNSRVYQSRIPLAPPTANPYFNPTLIAGCQLWLDGTDPLGNGSVPTNGTVISSWKDKSGKNVTTTGVNNPTYLSSAQGISFTNSSAQYYSLPNGTFPYGDSSYSYFIICNWNGNSGPYGLVGAGVLASDQLWVIRNTTGQNTVANYWYADDITTSTSMTPGQRTYISAFYSTGKGLRSVWINFFSGVSGYPANNRNQPNTNCTVGAAVVSQSEYMNGTISEVIVFNTNLIGTQQYIIEGYLAWKWGLQSSLPSNHPYLNVPPGVPWESSLTLGLTHISAINATGGTITIANGYKIHTFTTVGTTNFVVGQPFQLGTSVQLLIVAGGGSGSGDRAAGGGAGGLIFTNMLMSPGTYSVVVGAGGTVGTGNVHGTDGSNSSFNGQIAIGGGSGGSHYQGNYIGNTGGSGGGGAAPGPGTPTAAGGTGTSGQGYGGGTGYYNGSICSAGGGGGAGGLGSNATTTKGGNGGPGLFITIGGNSAYYAGGGGGAAAQDYGAAVGGIGGVGGGGTADQSSTTAATAGTPNTGGGGAGAGNAGWPGNATNGGSGIVIIAYPYP